MRANAVKRNRNARCYAHEGNHSNSAGAIVAVSETKLLAKGDASRYTISLGQHAARSKEVTTKSDAVIVNVASFAALTTPC